VAIKGDRLYTMGNDGTNDIVFCLKLANGEEVWRFAYPCKQGQHKGPRATPALDDKSVYTMSREGLVHRIDAKTGKGKWRKDLDGACQAKACTWGFSASPILEGNLLLLNAGKHGMALNKKTGQKAWGTGGIGGYAAPVVFSIGKRKCIPGYNVKPAGPRRSAPPFMGVMRLHTPISHYPWAQDCLKWLFLPPSSVELMARYSHKEGQAFRGPRRI